MYNAEKVHPRFMDFWRYFSKTKTSTTVELRKKVNSILHNLESIHYLTDEEVLMLRELYKTINIDEIMEEIDLIVNEEKTRITKIKKEGSLLRRMSFETSEILSEIAPKIIEKTNQNKNVFMKLKFYKKKMGFFISPHTGKDGEILNEYLKSAIKSDRLFLDLDSENENYLIYFSDPSDIAFMESLLYQKLFKGNMEGIKLLGIPIQLIISNCHYKNVPLYKTFISSFNEYDKSLKKCNPDLVYRKDIYSEDSIRFVIEQLMNDTKFESELYLACYLHYNYLLPMLEYINKRKMYLEKNNISLSYDEFKKKGEDIYKQLILRGEANVKWKNEMELFKRVAKYYPDAIYQYRSVWLENQSLDIYIPSLKIGIEYQGLQHYEPVEFFGGQEAFLYRQKLDALKVEKCNKNGVRLIHWHYQDVVSKINLERKMSKLHSETK